MDNSKANDYTAVTGPNFGLHNRMNMQTSDKNKRVISNNQIVGGIDPHPLDIYHEIVKPPINVMSSLQENKRYMTVVK